MEKKTEPGSTAGKKSKEDEDIQELAEEVLNSSDDEIIGLDEDAVVTADEDDEVIDLTDVSDPPLTDEDEILDLTEELQQSETEDDLTIGGDEEVMELEDITDVSADTEVAILELDEAIDALSGSEEESVAGAADESGEDIVDLHDTAEAGAAVREPATPAPAFTIETDTIELTESDREELERELGFEDEDEGFAESAPVAEQPADAEFPAGTPAQELDDTVELTERAGETAGDSPDGEPAIAPEEPLELTDEDRATLEEEIGADSFDMGAFDAAGPSEPLPMEESATAGFEEQVPETPGEPPGAMEAESIVDQFGLDAADLAPEEVGEDQTDPQPGAEEEIRFDAEELSMDDDADEQPPDIGLASEMETAESDSDALQQTMELADVNGEALQAEFDRDDADPAAAEVFADEEGQAVSEEILDVGLDDELPQMPAESAGEENNASLAMEELGLGDEPAVEMGEPNVSGSEEFTIESPADAAEEETPLSAEALTGPDIEPGSEMGVAGDRPSGTTFDSEEDESAAEIAGATTNGMSVDFDHTESFEQADMHKDADPISIRVKEPATDDHADEDALLNKVFDQQTDAGSPQDLEQTVERVVGKMLSEKIEVILAEAIEKAVEKEIGRLKKLLMDDLDRME